MDEEEINELRMKKKEIMLRFRKVVWGGWFGVRHWRTHLLPFSVICLLFLNYKFKLKQESACQFVKTVKNISSVNMR